MKKLTKIIWCLVFALLVTSQAEAGWRRRRRRCDTTPCIYSWRSCSVACGGGVQTSPYISRAKGACGKCVVPSPGPCNTQCCPVSCLWGWSGWSSCSLKCGSGKQYRKRVTFRAASCGGSPCSKTIHEFRSCNTRCCPVDCDWGSWSKYETCSKSCGRGTTTRSRSISVQSSCGGKTCPGRSIQYLLCNTQCCPVSCLWGDWSGWSFCSLKCGRGNQYRTRVPEREAKCGGRPCSGMTRLHRSCNNQCCPVDCVWDSWSTYGTCSESCGRGTTTRSRSISVQSSCGGKTCLGLSTENLSCNTQCCPVSCAWEDWSGWSSCTLTCGNGKQSRTRALSRSARCGGSLCSGSSQEFKSCNSKCCPVNCLTTSWSQWSECSTTCGSKGLSSRKRRIIVQPLCAGLGCPSLKKLKPCNRFCLHDGLLTANGCSCKNGWNGKCCENDINECENNDHDCSSLASCVNKKGSYSCVCKDGYTGNGFYCEDLNECSGVNNCATHATCTNTDGYYNCYCNAGYKGNGITCRDINECLTFTDNCQGLQAKCVNTDGGYYCDCKKFLQYKSGRCVDEIKT